MLPIWANNMLTTFPTNDTKISTDSLHYFHFPYVSKYKKNMKDKMCQVILSFFHHRICYVWMYGKNKIDN